MHGILVADDDADLRAAIRSLLGAEFEVLEAANGREAVEAARQGRPRLILLDITMPVMNGVDALRAIKAAAPSVTVVMLTSESDIAIAKKALELGACAFVTKPFDMDFLRTEARRLMSTKPVDTSGRPWVLRATAQGPTS